MDKLTDFFETIGKKIDETISEKIDAETIRFSKPAADVSEIHIASIKLGKADVVIDVLVTNPNPIPNPLVDIDYLIESNGRKLFSRVDP